MKIGITGIHGFLGWHLRVYLHGRPGIEVIGADRSTFGSDEALNKFVDACDVIVHLAGMNRGNDPEIRSTNIRLTEHLIAACERQRRFPHIIFASSRHVYRDTAYGRSKRECAERFKRWAEDNGGRCTNLILPHVFGECGKPFYNSAVATFCYQLANDQQPEVINDAELELVHAQESSAAVADIIEQKKYGEVTVSGTKIKVSDVLTLLMGMAQLYRDRVPELTDAFQLCLFNTYRSYLYPSRFPVSLTLHQDNRGSLFEAVRSLNGGQAFLSHTKPGITRGNHFHTQKFERFLVLSGEAVIRIRKMFAKEVYEFRVSGTLPQYVDMPTLHTHNITNVGSTELTTFFWSHELFDPSASDTVSELV